jgi:thiol-disulfide isomerase/thioredoxin
MIDLKDFAGFVVCLLLLPGCGSSAPSESDQSSPTATEATTDAPPEKPAAEESGAVDVQLDTLSFDEIQQRVAAKRGKVVVMDAWSTACPPCLKDFHNLVELHKEYGPDDLAAISLSFDYEGLGKPEDVREPVLKFLHSQGATFDNLMSNEESDVLYKKFKLNAVPAIFVYDRSGQLRERFENEGAYDDVRKLVAELVKEPAPEAAKQ